MKKDFEKKFIKKQWNNSVVLIENFVIEFGAQIAQGACNSFTKKEREKLCAGEQLESFQINYDELEKLVYKKVFLTDGEEPFWRKSKEINCLSELIRREVNYYLSSIDFVCFDEYPFDWESFCEKQIRGLITGEDYEIEGKKFLLPREE